MTDEEMIRTLAKSIETHRIERTVSLTDTTKYCEAICSFSNDMTNEQLPGYLFVGVDDDGNPVGAEITDQLLQNLASLRDNGQIMPMPLMSVFTVEMDGQDVAVVEVQPSDQPPVRYRGVTHIRIGPRRARASIQEERILSERAIANSHTWDRRECRESSLDDIALDLFTLAYLPNAIDGELLQNDARNTNEQMQALRLFGTAHPTNGSILLFGRDSLSFVPGAYVQYVRYDGVDQGDEVLSERRISGDLVNLLKQLDILSKEIARQRPMRQDDLSDQPTYDYPPVAMHELFMNAVIHRNYENTTTPININHYSDRIEITNPGSLYGDLRPDHFPGGTSYRNPILAEAAKHLGFVNMFGRGLTVAQRQIDQVGGYLGLQPGENHFLAIVGVGK